MVTVLQQAKDAANASEGVAEQIKGTLDDALESGNSALARLKLQVEEASKFAGTP